MDRQAVKGVFDGVHGLGDHDRREPEDRPEEHVAEKGGGRRLGEVAHGERGGGTCERDADTRGRDARQPDRNDRARAILEEQELDREQHGGDGRSEGRRHSGRRAGREQRLSLLGRDLHELSGK